MAPEEQKLTEVTLTRDALQRLGDDNSIVRQAARMLSLIAHNSVGLGEVLQDYAAQSQCQLNDFIQAAANLAHGCERAEDKAILDQAPFILSSVKTVLQMTPDAMTRNKAFTLGEKEKISREHVVQLTHSFLHSADIIRLLNAQDTEGLYSASHDHVHVAAGQTYGNDALRH